MKAKRGFLTRGDVYDGVRPKRHLSALKLKARKFIFWHDSFLTRLTDICCSPNRRRTSFWWVNLDAFVRFSLASLNFET
jgi:hypothetical protein